ncbi:MAG TPA: lytic transglycosylase domain-containing protein [Gemmatimonadaceae bacterium]|nr:lytic transglycosylase domain-containing protein [Gemmatimonadaceae bacterium]
MTKFKFGRIALRRKLESAGVFVVAVTAAGTIAANGPLMAPREAPPMTQILATQVAPEAAVARALDGKAEGVEWDIANIDHALVDKWVARFTGNMKSSLTTYITRMDKYDDMIAEKAEAKGLPKDLVYLAMIESGGLPTAKSPVSARGLWQFMSPTAREYGLTVRGRNDERIDPEKSTDAALDYLGDLHQRFGSWYLAAAAYNTGQGRVARILKQETGRTKGTDADFYRIAHRLPKETRDYVPKLIAAARIAKEPARYGFDVASAETR